jgi:hypothetical protein
MYKAGSVACAKADAAARPSLVCAAKVRGVAAIDRSIHFPQTCATIRDSCLHEQVVADSLLLQDK